MKATQPEHVVASQWLRAIDPDCWGKYHARYQSLREAGSLGHLDQGANGCFAGQAILINVAVKPHKDSNDDRGGWVATNCWGSFKGGDAVFPDLGARLRQGARDLVFSKSAHLLHWVLAITEGQRIGNARFMKNTIVNPPTPTFSCNRGCVNSKYTTQGSLARHTRTIHPAEYAAENPG